jgi:hypothetical protein
MGNPKLIGPWNQDLDYAGVVDDMLEFFVNNSGKAVVEADGALYSLVKLETSFDNTHKEAVN